MNGTLVIVVSASSYRQGINKAKTRHKRGLNKAYLRIKYTSHLPVLLLNAFIVSFLSLVSYN